MKLSNLFNPTILSTNHISNLWINDIKINAQDVQPGDMFVAITGQKYDGHSFIDKAIQNGAIFILCEKEIFQSIPHLITNNIKQELARISQIFYQYFPEQINIVGVTGTDGKTTTATILYHLLNLYNQAAYLGTNGFLTSRTHEEQLNTTPNPLNLYKIIKYLQDNTYESLVMEVSSEGILDKRIQNLKFKGAIFTNLTHEHLNTHHRMISYFKTKMQLFESLPTKALAITNNDCKYGKLVYLYTNAKLITYGIHKPAIYQAKNINLYLNKSIFDLYYKNQFLTQITVPLFGEYNIYNCLAAIAYAYETGISLEKIKKRLSTLIKVEGRFETLYKRNVLYVIDFAHTPNALKCLLSNLSMMYHKKIILVMGAAGERDSSKRAIMSKIAFQYADTIIFAPEDPKNENYFNILYQLTAKIKRKDYYITLTRESAIQLSTELAQANDIVIIIGKGNETTQKIGNYQFKYNDMQTLLQSLK